MGMFDRNGRHVYSVCKVCKRLRMASLRYGISVEQARDLYSISHCMCCGVEFTEQRFQHIHHTAKGCQGVVCQTCNHILQQETVEDLRRIEACLDFIEQPRKNLFDRVNPQGRLETIPSTTTRSARFGEQICNACDRVLPLDAFSVNKKWHRHVCKHCCVCSLQARVYNLTFEEVYQLRLRNVCDCCGCVFTQKNFAAIHHIQDRVLGLVCDACNRYLGQETQERVQRLVSCATWIKTLMI